MRTGNADTEKIIDWYKNASSESADFRDRGRKAFKYYMGDQWDASVKRSLERQAKPALTLNKVKPIIRTLSGFQRQNRRDLKVINRRGGDRTVAEMYTSIMKYIYDVSYADWRVSHCFMDGVICGKGWISLDIDYVSDPINGDMIISRENPFMILEDPYARRYDLSDASFIFRQVWTDMRELELHFPKVKNELTTLEGLSVSDRQRMGIETKDYSEEEREIIREIAKYRYLLKECWYKEYEKTTFLIDRQSLTVELVRDEDAARQVVALNETAGTAFELITRIYPRLHLVTMVGDIVLQDIKDPLGGKFNDYPFVRFCNEMILSDQTHYKGEVEDLFDPQDEHNKRRSQALHHINTSGNSGWIVEKGAMDPKEVKKLERMGSKPGVVVQVKDGRRSSIEKITPSQLSQGHVQLDQMAEDDMKKISNVNADMLGADKTRSESGIAMEIRRAQGLVGTEPIFDNFSYTERILGNTILNIVRHTDVFSEQELVAIAEESQFTKLTPEEMSMALKDRSIGKYSVVLGSRPSSPTARLSNFMTLLDAAQKGLPIPPSMIAEASDWPNKEELVERFKAQEQPQPQPAPVLPEMQGQPGMPI